MNEPTDDQISKHEQVGESGSEDQHTKCDDPSKPSCVGGCGGPGLCPGIAIMIAWIVGAGVLLVTGQQWLAWAIGVPLALILITGVWRRFIGRA